MSKFIDLTGQRFGRLVVIRRAADHIQPSGQKKRKWVCKCDCGKEIEAREDSLKTGNTKSCGCSRKDYTDARIEDLTGQRFGRLKALSFSKKEAKTGTVVYWKCKCDCGKHVNIRSYDLRHGKIQNCGCERKEKSDKREDISGQQFGNLTAIRLLLPEEKIKGRDYNWLCRCICGNEIQTSINRLRSGKAKDCGCITNNKNPKEDLSNKKIGDLTVLEYIGDSKWDCLCKCGNKIIVSSHQLKFGIVKSCIECKREKSLDLIGRKFGELLVVERDSNSNQKHTYWICKCACGSIVSKRQDLLLSGASKYCYAFCDEKYDDITLKGIAKRRIHYIWVHMKQRCYNENSPSYKYYGARGITVCDEWINDFVAFRNWSYQNGYSDELSIDRIDVNGNYCPENCRWVDDYIQANNKTNNCILEFNNQSHTLAEWSRIVGINWATIWTRIFELSWSVEDALTIPAIPGRKNSDERIDIK